MKVFDEYNHRTVAVVLINYHKDAAKAGSEGLIIGGSW